MTALDKRARIAGGLYMATFVPGLFSLMYVPSRFIVSGDPAATVAKVLGGEELFRWGIFGEMTGAALWVAVIVALYRLFADVDRFWAWMMAGLAAMCAPVMLLNVLSELAVLSVVTDPGLSQTFTPAQLQKVVQLLLHSHEQGFVLLKLFSGLWLFPLAVLVWRSDFMPRALAALQVIAGLSYLLAASTAIVSPPLLRTVDPITGLASTLGETPAMLWLLFMGAKVRARAATPPVSAPASA